MRWKLQWGEKLDFLKGMQEAGNTPPALLNQPRLKPWLVWYYDAFMLLSASRPTGMTVGAIPLSEFRSYMEMFGVDDIDERVTFIKMMKALDSAWLTHVREKHERERAKKKADTPRRWNTSLRGPRRGR